MDQKILIAALKIVVGEVDPGLLKLLDDWVGSHKGFDEISKMKIPDEYKKVPYGDVYRGMTVSKKQLDSFRDGEPLKVGGSWSVEEEAAKYFAEADTVVGNKEFGILLSYAPSTKDVIVNVKSVVTWLDDNMDENEIEDQYPSLPIDERGTFESEVLLRPVELDAQFNLDAVWDIKKGKYI